MELAFEDLKNEYHFQVTWHPFLLRPDMPPDGFPKPPSHLHPSPGSPLKKTGEKLGIDFAFKSTRYPNTVMSHALLEYAKERGGAVVQNQVAERLFKKYFTDGDHLREDTVLAIAREVGFDETDARKFVSDQSVIENVRLKAREWSERGISGVPTFYINGQRMFSGAQEPEVFKRMVKMAAERFPVQTGSNI